MNDVGRDVVPQHPECHQLKSLSQQGITSLLRLNNRVCVSVCVCVYLLLGIQIIISNLF